MENNFAFIIIKNMYLYNKYIIMSEDEIEQFIMSHEKLIKEFEKDFRKNVRRLSEEAGVEYTSEDDDDASSDSGDSGDSGDGDGSDSSDGSDGSDSSEENEIIKMSIYNIIQSFYDSKRFVDITDMMIFCVYEDQFLMFEFILDAIIELHLKMPTTEISRWTLITAYLHELVDESDSDDDDMNILEYFQEFMKKHKKLAL
jgi:hypothetical protein